MASTGIRWLHLSDLHMGLTDSGTDRTTRRSEFLDDVEAVVAASGGAPDLVIFTGDLTQRAGKKEFDQLDGDWLEPLWQRLGVQPPLLAVPGNHDLARPPESERDYGRRLLTEPGAREQIWKPDTAANKFVRARFREYDRWWKKRRPNDIQEGFLPGDFTWSRVFGGVRLGVAGLNTALLHLGDEAREGTLHVHPTQLRRAMGNGDEVGSWLTKHDVTLLLSHHPPTWLHPDCRDDELEGGLQVGRFSFHLFGHMHEPIAEETRRGGDQLRRRLQAPSLFGRETYTVLGDEGERSKNERRFGYSMALLEPGAQPQLTLWPREAVRARDRHYRFGSDRSYRLDRDILVSRPFGAPAPRGVPRRPVGEARPVCSDPKGWSAAVEAHTMWSTAGASPWKLRAIEVARVAAEAVNSAGSPWDDPDLPLRVLDRLVEMLGDARPRPEQVFLLSAAPFLYEAVRGKVLGWVFQSGVDDFQPRTGGAPRPVIEQVHRAYAREVRSYERVQDPGKRAAIVRWLAERVVDRLPEAWGNQLAVIVELHRRVGVAVADPAANDVLWPIARCLGPGLEVLDGERGLRGRDQVVGGSGVEQEQLGALLCAAGATALDLRRADPLIVDHLRDNDDFDLGSLRRQVQSARWTDHEGTWALTAVCDEPVQHFLLTELARQAGVTVEALWGRAHTLGSLPRATSVAGISGAVDERGVPRFETTHVRFRLDHVRVRELLMGQQLYQDPALAIRELYQNALDACRYRRVRNTYLRCTRDGWEQEYQGRIVFRQGVHPDGRVVIECEDDGVGMDALTVERVFAVAGQRFHDQPRYLEEKARWEKERLKRGENGKELEHYPNSQHGIGVLSYFMLADEVEVLTRPFREEDGQLGRPIRVVISSANGLFRVSAGPESMGAGTRVRLVLGDPPPASVAQMLAAVLVVAEVPVEAYGGCERVGEVEWRLEAKGEPERAWVPGVPRYYQFGGDDFHEMVPGELWGADSHSVPVLVDGVATAERRARVLMNLRGARYPKRLSADRQKLIEFDETWVEEAIGNKLAVLASWPGLSMWWLYGALLSWPVAFRRGWDALIEQEPVVPMASGNTNGSDYEWTELAERSANTRVSLKEAGIVYQDVLLFAPDRAHTRPGWMTALDAWRRCVWTPERVFRDMGRTPPNATRIPVAAGLGLPDAAADSSMRSPPESSAAFRRFVTSLAGLTTEEMLDGRQQLEITLGYPAAPTAVDSGAARLFEPRSPGGRRLNLRGLIGIDHVAGVVSVRPPSDFHATCRLLCDAAESLGVRTAFGITDLAQVNIEESDVRLFAMARAFGRYRGSDRMVELTSGSIVRCSHRLSRPVHEVLERLRAVGRLGGLIVDPRAVSSSIAEVTEEELDLVLSVDYRRPLLDEVSGLHVLRIAARTAESVETTAHRIRAVASKLSLPLLDSVDLVLRHSWDLVELETMALLPPWVDSTIDLRDLLVDAKHAPREPPPGDLILNLVSRAGITATFTAEDVEVLRSALASDSALRLVMTSRVDFELAARIAGGVPERLADAFQLLARGCALTHVTPLFDLRGASARDWSRSDQPAISFLALEHGRFSKRPTVSQLINALGVFSPETLAAYASAVTLAPMLGYDFGPKASPPARTLVDTLHEKFRAEPSPYPDFDPLAHAELWLLLAAQHTCDGLEPLRAARCAGRWWAWWLTDDEIEPFAQQMIPILIAEVAWAAADPDA